MPLTGWLCVGDCGWKSLRRRSSSSGDLSVGHVVRKADSLTLFTNEGFEKTEVRMRSMVGVVRGDHELLVALLRAPISGGCCGCVVTRVEP